MTPQELDEAIKALMPRHSGCYSCELCVTAEKERLALVLQVVRHFIDTVDEPAKRRTDPCSNIRAVHLAEANLRTILQLEGT